MIRNHCLIYLDATGEPLHKRGYRKATAKAPLNETLAAAVLRLAGWKPGLAFVDPLCGSGTLVIEAARREAGLAPGGERSNAIETWPCYQAAWEPVLPDPVPLGEAEPVIRGNDRDAGAIEAATVNAERGRVADRISLTCGSLSSTELTENEGCLVTNPPYGRRIRSGKDLRNLYAALGNLIQEKGSGWSLTLICPDPMLVAATGLDPQPVLRFRHGGLSLGIWRAGCRSRQTPATIGL
jgi:putative N6-adenine-specific DNA methylase